MKSESESHRLSISPPFRSRYVPTVNAIDELRAAVTADFHFPLFGDAHTMAAIAQTVDNNRRNGGFEKHFAALADFPARRVGSGLRILTVVEHAHGHLKMTLGLHIPSHDAEAHHRLSVLRKESGNDGVERTLATGDLIGMARLQSKTRAAILQADAGSRNDDA